MSRRSRMYPVNAMDDVQSLSLFREGFLSGINYAIDSIEQEIKLDNEQRECMFREGFLSGIIYAIDSIKHEIALDKDPDTLLEDIMLRLSDAVIREQYEVSNGFQ